MNCQLGFNIPRRTKNRTSKCVPVKLQGGAVVNQGWVRDFMHDLLFDGLRFRTMRVIDGANREALCMEVGIAIPSARLIRALNRLIDWYGAPGSIRMDNGPEMTSHDFIDWAAAKDTKLNHIESGESNQNACIERFKRTYRHEVLDAYVFKSIEQGGLITEDWLSIYIAQFPPEALAGLPPEQFLPSSSTTADSSSRLPT